MKELELRCVSTIQLCIVDNIINNVMDENSALTLWEKLEKFYLAKTNKLHLKWQFYRLGMEEGGNLMEHMNVFNGYLYQLRKVDVKIEEPFCFLLRFQICQLLRVEKVQHLRLKVRIREGHLMVDPEETTGPVLVPKKMVYNAKQRI
ncbi:hypothetical protein Vadar_025300 [Vaccinium darrowii]|nr:hypothetical protein Vadar_025300 [Vaccinium darrowii]